MNGEPVQRKVRIINPQGFHMRPITAFAELANRFASTVNVRKEADDKVVNGKSPLELMFLGAEQGTELVIEAAGDDAQQALTALADLLANLGTSEAEPPLPPQG